MNALSDHKLLFTSALKCCTFRLLTVTGIASFYTDLACMTIAILIIHAIHCFTINLAFGEAVPVTSL